MRVSRYIPEERLPDKAFTSPTSMEQQPEHLDRLYSEQMLTTSLRALNQKSIQEMLYQIVAPALFLDSNLDIVFFTSTMMTLLDILPSDLGRPLADICSRAQTFHLLTEVQQAVRSTTLRKTVIALNDGRSFDCTIKCCPPWEDEPKTVVLVFTETTEVRRPSSALTRIHQPPSALDAPNVEQWHCIDQKLRQPAQSIALLTGKLGAIELDPASPTRGLLEQLGETVEILFDRLNAGFEWHHAAGDIDQQDAQERSLQDIFRQLAEDLLPLSIAQQIKTRIVPSSLQVKCHPDNLRQLLSALTSSIMTSANVNRLSIGCRRHSEWVSIEVRYTGTGNRDDALRMLTTPGHKASLSDPLANKGTYSVYKLSVMLNLQLHVRTQPGKGTLISISAPLSPSLLHQKSPALPPIKRDARSLNKTLDHLLLIVEPDGWLRDLLSRTLGMQGYQVATASNATTALEWIAQSGIQPDLVLTEYSLEQQMDGVQLMQKMRDLFNRVTPAIVLTADTRKQVFQSIQTGDCMQFRKPVGLNMLLFTIDTALRPPPAQAPAVSPNQVLHPVVYLVDDDNMLRKTLRGVLEAHGYEVRDYCSSEEFFDRYAREQQACLIVDAHMPGISGLEVVSRLRAMGDELPIIMISSNSRIATVVNAMKTGVCDFIEKPFRCQDVLTSVTSAMLSHWKTESFNAIRKAAIDHIASLTARQRQIMAMVLAGQPSKNIAVDLEISQRTVEKHRAAIMVRTKARSIPELARIAMSAGEQYAQGDRPDAASPMKTANGSV